MKELLHLALLVSSLLPLSVNAQDPEVEVDDVPPYRLLPVKDPASGRYGYASGDGRRIPPRFEEARSFVNGHAVVRIEGYWGLIDTTGRIVCGPTYQLLFPVEDGYTLGVPPGSSDACLVRVGDRPVCVPFTTYFDAWKAELRASALPDKELVIRVLEMSREPSRVYAEMLNLEATYTDMPEVRAAATRRSLGTK